MWHEIRKNDKQSSVGQIFFSVYYTDHKGRIVFAKLPLSLINLIVGSCPVYYSSPMAHK